MMAAIPKIDEHDNPGAIRPWWHGINCPQIAQAPKLELETVKKIFRNATKALQRGGRTVKCKVQLNGPQCSWVVVQLGYLEP